MLDRLLTGLMIAAASLLASTAWAQQTAFGELPVPAGNPLTPAKDRGLAIGIAMAYSKPSLNSDTAKGAMLGTRNGSSLAICALAPRVPFSACGVESSTSWLSTASSKRQVPIRPGVAGSMI